MISEKEFQELQRIANALVDAEALPCWDNSEVVKRDKARSDALEAMRMIGTRRLEKIGKEPDWGS